MIVRLAKRTMRSWRSDGLKGTVDRGQADSIQTLE